MERERRSREERRNSKKEKEKEEVESEGRRKKKKDLGGQVPGCCVLLGNFFKFIFDFSLCLLS